MKNIFYESIKDKMNGIFAEKQQEYDGRMHFHRAFELAYITEGSAHYIVEDEEFIAREGDIVFCHCYYRHTSTVDFPHTKYIVAVPEKLSKDAANLFKDSTLPVLLSDKTFNKTLLPYFELLASEGESMTKILSRGYANILFGSLAGHYNNIAVKPKNKNVEVIADILNYIDEHFRDRITLESISAHFGYNKTYFSRLFNQHIGMSMSNYINMVRYDAFERMYGNKMHENTTELVFDCGFSSLATFYRVREFRNKS
jgi:AraC-like DNA-binding protein